MKGVFLYLDRVIDIWSRRIMGWAIHPSGSSDHAAALIARAVAAAGVRPGTLVIHSDNGGPMRGATLLAALQKHRGGAVVLASRVSDAPFSEARFRTLKYVLWCSEKPFADVEGFVRW